MDEVAEPLRPPVVSRIPLPGTSLLIEGSAPEAVSTLDELEALAFPFAFAGAPCRRPEEESAPFGWLTPAGNVDAEEAAFPAFAPPMPFAAGTDLATGFTPAFAGG
eukprot:CAMPEP_0117553722 /NCGR_PEP_ID=MMETSP0784-20121206/50373_1 /TAXON_ID=39447 /ORGANISM="" /LENGTH=105 /DNA_ID=CAMNT_0005350841 /DNA_START=328 /DNA_END=642 /DNA_ORIENTATION=-